MKPNNLLMNRKGTLKIADFGLAKFYGSPNRLMTHQVVTRFVLSSPTTRVPLNIHIIKYKYKYTYLLHFLYK